MSTSPSKVAKDAKNVKPCLVFELETVAFNGGQAMYEVAEAAFKAREFQLTPEIFIRFNLSHPTPRVLQHMATAMAINANNIEAMSAEIVEQWQQKLAQTAPNLVVAKLLGDAAKQGIPLGAVTTLPEELASGLIKALALNVEVALVKLPTAGGNSRPRQEFWAKLARQMQVAPAQCGVGRLRDRRKRPVMAGSMSSPSRMPLTPFRISAEPIWSSRTESLPLDENHGVDRSCHKNLNELWLV